MTTALWEPAAAADSRHRMAAIFVHNHSPARGRHFAVFFFVAHSRIWRTGWRKCEKKVLRKQILLIWYPSNWWCCVIVDVVNYHKFVCTLRLLIQSSEMLRGIAMMRVFVLRLKELYWHWKHFVAASAVRAGRQAVLQSVQNDKIIKQYGTNRWHDTVIWGAKGFFT